MSTHRPIFLLVALGSLALPSSARAAELAVPARLQAELLIKIAGYERNMAARAGDAVRVLLIAKRGDASAARAAGQLRAELERDRRVGPLPVEVRVIEIKEGRELPPPGQQAIFYFMPGFQAGEVTALVAAIADRDLLTVGADVAYVEQGVVLAFDLAAGKPKLILHRGAARRHNVVIPAEVLRLMKVIE